MESIRENDMKIKLIEDPRVCPACDAQITDLGLPDRQCSSCGMQRNLGTNETKRTDEHVRLLLSWDAVMRETGIREVGSSRW
jgi:hypothetical protein